ncbi:MAG: EscN/YscN/HrcN family type III secretion system ATPase, partial [Acidimicrobiia bacterium]|nr:EscN/YscN/HrcN family type III secretion system ATPase [Acidimicrobiia bacterium]
GREVREFLERDLGSEGLSQSVVVVATAEQPAVVRRRAAFVATRIAEWFREEGNDVLLLMDSLTRFAMAHREIGLAAGELPTSRGYPPSIPAELSLLLERAGTTPSGSITGIYTVLVEGDDTDDPIGDTARSLLDGHIVLRRSLAESGHFPAVDVLSSASRVAPSVTTASEQRIMTEIRDILATEADVKDLVQVGAYQAGSDPAVDRALRLAPGVRAVLRQPMTELTARADTFALLADALRVEEILT